jgi:murein DD-endopeptidase MepM/ murein hydrolase activator NlpD
MSGGAQSSAISVLMSAENLEDLLTKSELTKSISAYDSALMQKIVDDMKAIEDNKAQINQLKADQEATKTVLKAKKDELNKQIREVKDIIADLDDEMDDLKDQADKIEDAISEYEEAIKNAQNVGSDQKYDGDFAWPCPGYYYISSPYGYRNHPISGKYKFHKGIDIAGSGIKGKPIYATREGVVAYSGWYGSGGHTVKIDHLDGFQSIYMHMTNYIVKEGDFVTAGQIIGYVGSTGGSTGPHLHFEIRYDGTPYNPMQFIG